MRLRMLYECIFWSLYAIVYGQSSWAVQAKARLDITLKLTLEGMQVLFQIHIEEGQSAPVIVQSQPYSDWVHCDPQVRALTIV